MSLARWKSIQCLFLACHQFLLCLEVWGREGRKEPENTKLAATGCQKKMSLAGKLVQFLQSGVLRSLQGITSRHQVALSDVEAQAR